MAALLAIALGAGAIATTVGIRVYQYRFEGQDPEGAYYFSTEPEVVSEGAHQDVDGADRTHEVTKMNSADGTDPEQARMDLEEIALLRQQDARELVGVFETQVNGYMDRSFNYRYILTDGRELTFAESKPLEEEEWEQLSLLREKDERELVRVIDTEVDGELDRFFTYIYILADGRAKTVGEPDAGLARPERLLSSERTNEIEQLRRLKQGEFVGYEDKQVQGRTFTFDTYVFTLSDGTVVTHGVGQPKGLKFELTETDSEEFQSLLNAEAGEDLGIVEKEIEGQVFVFTRHKFVLSDGTEVIWSPGTPKNNQ